jgi:hypothetical protein
MHDRSVADKAICLCPTRLIDAVDFGRPIRDMAGQKVMFTRLSNRGLVANDAALSLKIVAQLQHAETFKPGSVNLLI